MFRTLPVLMVMMSVAALAQARSGGGGTASARQGTGNTALTGVGNSAPSIPGTGTPTSREHWLPREQPVYHLKANERIVADPGFGEAYACTKGGRCRLLIAPMPVRARLMVETLGDALRHPDDPLLAIGPYWDDNVGLTRVGTPQEIWGKVRYIYCEYARQGLEPSVTYLDLDNHL
jgi:hypothetical protein